MPELRSEYSRHCLEMGKKVFGNKKIVKRITCIMVIVFGVLHIIVKKSKLESVYEDQPEQKNPLEGKTVVFIENTMEKENADVLAYRRNYQGEELIVLNNLTAENVTIRQQPEWKAYQKRLGNYEKITAEDGKITLRPFETIVLDSAL